MERSLLPRQTASTLLGFEICFYIYIYCKRGGYLLAVSQQHVSRL